MTEVTLPSVHSSHPRSLRRGSPVDSWLQAKPLGSDRRVLKDVVQRIARELVGERLGDAVDLVVVLALREREQLAF